MISVHIIETLGTNMKVTKRDKTLEDFSVEKIHKVVQWATKGINGVSFSDIEMNANLSLYDNIKTKEIHNVLIKSANDLISKENPNYQYVAARLLNMQLRKEVWGGDQVPDFLNYIRRNVDNEVYDPELENKWTEEIIDALGKYINHSRDDKFTYAGLQQMIDKYSKKQKHRKNL